MHTGNEVKNLEEKQNLRKTHLFHLMEWCFFYRCDFLVDSIFIVVSWNSACLVSILKKGDNTEGFHLHVPQVQCCLILVEQWWCHGRLHVTWILNKMKPTNSNAHTYDN